MRRRQSIYRQGFMCAAAFGFAYSAHAQAPSVPAQPQPAAVTSPAAPVPVPVRPLPPTIEEREDPFQPPPTEAEKRAEEERRLRELVRPLIDQMRDSINQGVNGQIQEGLRSAIEEFGRQGREAQPQGSGKPGKRVKAPGEAVDKPDPDDEKAEKAEARAQAALEKATEMASDPDPLKRQEGRARLEQIRRGQMPKWSSSEGVFFIGCINKRKLYRDRFGDIFQSELWFNGSSGAGGTSANSYAAAARPGGGQQTASAGAAPVGAGASSNVAAVDPCAD